MGAANDITEPALRELAAARGEGEVVLSLYLDLDPGHFATAPARASEIDSLLDGAHREIEDGDRPHAELMALRASLERAREILDPQMPQAQGARALAVFLSGPLALERVMRLPHPARTAAVVADGPFIEPLAEERAAGRVCVVLLGERDARLLRGGARALHEVSSYGDDVHGRHHQGGWSQARYQRSVHEEVDGHLRHIARVLHALLRVAPYDTLLIATGEPLYPRLLERLHPDVRARLLEHRVEIDLSAAGPAEVEEAVRPLLDAEQREHEQRLLAELREHLARDGDTRAAAGLDAVLAALVERRVAALLYDAGSSAPGVRCPRCGWMGGAGESCPVDGGPLEPREDVVEDAVAAALEQSAEVVALHDRPDLGPLGGIAATLRF